MSSPGPFSFPPLSPDPQADELLPEMTPPPRSQPQSQSQPRSLSPPPIGLIVGAVVGGLVLLVVLGYCIIWYRRRKADNQISSKSEDGISRPKPQPGEPKSQGLILFILYFNELVNQFYTFLYFLTCDFTFSHQFRIFYITWTRVKL